MGYAAASPGLRWPVLLTVALTVSLGWGIRGNFGHEYGAMIPGALAAIAVCLLSGREDWRRRAVYFAFFGALGWAFGGSISYGHVIAYTHSGHYASQLYGFACLFAIGFLWAALGTAGTAFPAVVSRDRLTELFRPLLWVFAAWLIAMVVGRMWVIPFLENAGSGAHRHASPLYWLDSDWTAAVIALIAVCLFDLWDQRFRKTPILAVFAATGAFAGYLLKGLFDWVGISGLLRWAFVRTQGDTALILRAQELGVDVAADTIPQREFLSTHEGQFDTLRDDLLTNWPAFLQSDTLQPHLGWILGLIVGAALYFRFFGSFRSGARLILYLALGWLAGFILLPVLLGLSMTPPRSDNWAGVLGVFCAVVVYCFRTRIASVAYASIIGGVIGGIGFSGAALLKLAFVRPGNPAMTNDPAVVADWSHWQSANWHSVLEQSYGFVSGIGLAVAMGLLAMHVRHVDDPPTRGWTRPFALCFVLLFMVYANWRKAVGTWVAADAVPARMNMPLIESVSFSAEVWFSILYWIVAGAIATLIVRHARKPIPIVPATALGRGQLLFVMLLMVVVVLNFERALVSFTADRLITEGVIIVAATAAALLLISLTRLYESQTHIPPLTKTVPYERALVVALLVFIGAVALETWTVRALYGDTHAGHSGLHTRFGPDAEWRVNPLVRTRPHD